MSASGVFGPAPEGINLSQTQNASIRYAVISLMVIGTIAVALRLIARSLKKLMELAMDDYCIVLGLIFAHGTAFCSLVSLPYGGGKHLWVLTGEEFTSIWQILFAYVMIYACAVTFTKLSIVLFYQRLFGMNWGLWFCTFLIMSYWVTVIVTINVSCRPLSYFWTQYTTKGATGHCINVPLFFFANGIWAMLVDVCILIVPLPIIYRLEMPKSQKIVVCFILLLGSFVCIASVVRITTIHTVINSSDLTWAMGQLFIWSCCEPFIGIVCACLPTLAPFFRRWWATLRTKPSGGSSFEPGFSSSGPESISFSKNPSREGKKSLDTTANGNGTGKRQGSVDVRLSKTKREWTRLPNHGDVRLRGDNEVQLTNEIMSGPGRDEEMGFRMRDIHVKKDVSWNSTLWDDGVSQALN